LDFRCSATYNTLLTTPRSQCTRFTTSLPTATVYNAGVLVLRNLIGFVGMLLSWLAARTFSSAIEEQLHTRLFVAKPCFPRLLRSAIVFSAPAEIKPAARAILGS
jgi:hypothetical protein